MAEKEQEMEKERKRKWERGDERQKVKEEERMGDELLNLFYSVEYSWVLPV